MKTIKVKNTKRYLDKNSLVNESSITELTEDEEILIAFFIKAKWMRYRIPTIVPISKRLHLDFIGYNNEQYMDVLICNTNNRNVIL